MKEFQASTKIQATPEKVWEVLTNLEAYPEWDPNCEKIEGKLALGQKIKAFTKLSPGKAFGVKVTELTPEQKMVWTAGMPLGLFKGERTFTLKKNGPKETAFEVKEIFTGPMLALIGGSIPDLNGPFEQFVDGLKRRAEAS